VTQPPRFQPIFSHFVLRSPLLFTLMSNSSVKKIDFFLHCPHIYVKAVVSQGRDSGFFVPAGDGSRKLTNHAYNLRTSKNHSQTRCVGLFSVSFLRFSMVLCLAMYFTKSAVRWRQAFTHPVSCPWRRSTVCLGPWRPHSSAALRCAARRGPARFSVSFCALLQA
jgi:hypothetical protein